MMTNIFSNFDPMWFNLCYKNSIMIIMPILMAANLFWYNNNKLFLSYNPFMSYVTTQLMKTKMKHMKSMLMLTKSMFILIIYMNMLSMVPYLFSLTSHIILTMSLAIPMWTMLIMSSFTFNKKKAIGHLLPDSAPMMLNPFLIMIESISIMIRPLTLSFRLTANMTAGHVVMSLFSLFSISPDIKPFMLIIFMSMSYTMFEMMICMIQAYIFCLLISLYSNDHS